LFSFSFSFCFPLFDDAVSRTNVIQRRMRLENELEW
jgi:hypothetical protein